MPPPCTPRVGWGIGWPRSAPCSIWGVVRHEAGQYPGVGQALQAALDIYRDLGDRLGQANALHGLGVVAERTGERTGQYPAAAGALEEALGIYRDLGDRLGQTRSLMRLGQVRLGTADYLGAARFLEMALDIARDLGSRLDEGNALWGWDTCGG
jgi:tetratricopeptide (TPR) repeat protein